MKARLLIVVALWAGSVAAAWWLGHRTGYSSQSSRLIATREAADGPDKPKAPGSAKAETNSGGAAKSGGSGASSEGSAGSLQSILAQVKSLLRTGGMQNPSAMLKTITLLGQIKDEDIQAALKEAGDFKEPQSKALIEMVLLSRWAEFDGPAALKYANDTSADRGPMMQMAKMGVLSSWAQSDPEAAWKYVQSEESDSSGMFGGRGMMMMGLFSSFASKDPDTAFNRLAELDDPQERQMALNGIAQTAYDDSSRSRLMDYIAQLPDKDERRDARAAMLSQLAMMEPDQAITLTNELPQEERKEVAQRVGSTLMMSDPERGANFILEHAEPDKKGQAYQTIVSQWASHDPNKAGTWLGAQPQTPELDSARSSFATQVANRDPESAMAWANTVTEDGQRAFAVEQVFNTWKKKDEAAALAALESSGLPPERLEAIRTGKKVGDNPPTPTQIPGR